MPYETVKRLGRASEFHDHFRQPIDKDAAVWRYFPSSRFMSAIKSRTLWFARSDQLAKKDPCEGTRTEADAATLALLRQGLVESGNRAEAFRVRALFRRGDSQARLSTFISCWQMQASDMISMWERYCTTPSVGIAIQTTYARLDAAAPLHSGPHQSIMMGLMQYGNAETDLSDDYSLFMNKRPNYADEREVRLLYRTAEASSLVGSALPVDFTTLVDRIVVSPFASEMFRRRVEQMCRREGFKFEVERSSARQVVTAY